MAGHLGYEKNSGAGDGRNGHAEKTALLENQGTAIEVPRGRDGTLGPAIAPKHGKRMPPFSDQIISTHSFGMSGRGIQKHLEQVCNVEASLGLISRVADGAIGEAGEWRNRPLEKSCAIACMDALRAKGRKEALGLRIAENEGAKLWMGVLTGLKNRGVQGIPIACMGGLSGFFDALRAVCPQARIQLCIARMARDSVKFVSCKGLKKLCADLKQMYSDDDEEAGHGNAIGMAWAGFSNIRLKFAKGFIRLTRLNR